MLQFVIEVTGIDGNYHYFKEPEHRGATRLTDDLKKARVFSSFGEMVNTLLQTEHMVHPLVIPGKHEVRLVTVKTELVRGNVIHS